MLPPHLKLPGSGFRSVIRRGQRAGRSTVVVHVLHTTGSRGYYPRFGLIVSKAVGNAVARHATSRKLRHAIIELLPQFPDNADVVIRALPPSAKASLDELIADIQAAAKKIQRSPKKR